MSSELTDAELDEIRAVAEDCKIVDFNTLWSALQKLRWPGITAGSIDWLRWYCQSIIEAHDAEEKRNDE